MVLGPSRKQTQYQAAVESDITPAFLELFAGAAGLTRAVAAQGCVTMDPVETRLGDSHAMTSTDIADDAVFARIKKEIRQGKVRWLHAAPPCRTFTKARRTDRFGSAPVLRSSEVPEGEPEVELQVANANELMRRTAVLAKACIRAGAWFSIENPERSYAWDFSPIKSLAELPGVLKFIGSQCVFGCEYRKNTTWLTNVNWMEVAGQMCPGQPQHPVHPVLQGHI
jgi:hypothetical protein